MRATAYNLMAERTATIKRAFALMIGRFAVILTTMSALFLPNFRAACGRNESAIFVLLLSLAIVSGPFFITTRRARHPRTVLTLQLLTDLFAITIFVFLTGGENSSFIFLYFATIILAGAMLAPNASVMFASASTIAMACVSLVRHTGLLGLHTPAEAQADWIGGLVYTLVVNALGFYVVALLTTALAGRLKKLRDLNQQIVEQFGNGLLVLNAADRIIFANDIAARILGFKDRNNILNRLIDAIFRRDTDRDLKAALAARPTDEIEVRYQRAHEEAVDLGVSTYPLEGGRTKNRGVIVVIRDLTDKKKMQQAARIAEQLKEIRQMSAGLAHEIRNPLASIRACAQQMGDHHVDEDSRRKISGIICRESDRLDRIITDFLDFAKMRPPKRLHIDLAEILDEVCELVEARRCEKAFTLQRAYPRALRCLGDRDQMMQLFLNLAINAFQAIEPGGRVTIAAQTPPQNAPGERRKQTSPNFIVTVDDDGCGISESNMAHIFTPFFSTKDSGAGLGLSIVNAIIEQHAIHLETKSGPGNGTTFRLNIPFDNSRTDNSGGETDPTDGARGEAAPSIETVTTGA